MNKKITLLVCLCLLLVGGILVGIFWDPIIDWLPIDQSGWDVLDNGGVCYLDEDGDPLTGWQTIDGKKYYFGCNVLGKLLAQLKESKGKIPYSLPDDLHLFGKPILPL